MNAGCPKLGQTRNEHHVQGTSTVRSQCGSGEAEATG